MAAKEKKREEKQDHFDTVCGILLALFAAVLAVSGLGGGNTAKGQMVAQTEKGSAYQWYNSKSIKQNLSKGQLDSLESMLKSGVVAKTQEKTVKEDIERFRKNVDRYDAAGMEILEGSNLTALKKIEAAAFEKEILPKIKKDSDRQLVQKYFSKDKDGKFYSLKSSTSYVEMKGIFSVVVGQTGYKSPRWVQDLNGEFGKIIGANEWAERSQKIADADEIFDMANLFLQLCLVLGAISIVLKRKRIKHIIFGSMIAVGIIGSIYTVIGFVSSAGTGM
jgi:hypothetical protein